MRESIGGAALFTIVIIFILLFAGYISFSINYSKAYNIKNEVINIIKNQGGICTGPGICANFSNQITDYFKDSNYRSTGNCDDDWVGFFNDGRYLGNNAKNAAFCVHAVKAASASELPNALYYQVKVFYTLGLPIIELVADFSITGETPRIYSPNECNLINETAPLPGAWCS